MSIFYISIRIFSQNGKNNIDWNFTLPFISYCFYSFYKNLIDWHVNCFIKSVSEAPHHIYN